MDKFTFKQHLEVATDLFDPTNSKDLPLEEWVSAIANRLVDKTPDVVYNGAGDFKGFTEPEEDGDQTVEIPGGTSGEDEPTIIEPPATEPDNGESESIVDEDLVVRG